MIWRIRRAARSSGRFSKAAGSLHSGGGASKEDLSGGFDGLGRDEILADGGVQGGEGELGAVAGLDEILVRLRELGFEVEDVGLDGAAGVEAFLGDAEAFLDAGDGLRLHLGERLGLEDAVEAAGHLVDELVAGGGEGLGLAAAP